MYEQSAPGRMPVCQDGAEVTEVTDDGGRSVSRPAGPQQFPLHPYNFGGLAGHSQKKSALLGSSEEACRRGTSLPESAKSRAEGEAEELSGPTEGRKGGRVDRTACTAASRIAGSTGPKRAHGRPPAGQNASPAGRGGGSG